MVKKIEKIDPVEAQDEIPEIPADPTNNIPGQAFQAAVRRRIGRPETPATTWDEGIKMIRNAISKYSNQVMARYKLMFEMPATDHTDYRKWCDELLEQAKRCQWEEYGAEQAALDALLYQCPNQSWKDKIMEGKVNFHEAVEYGLSKLAARQEGKKITVSGVKPETTPELPLDRLDTKKDEKVDCKRCFEKHEIRNCPAWGYRCSKCQMPNHLANSQECKDKANPPAGAERPGRGNGRW